MRHTTLAALLALALCGHARPAAAETYQTCAGFIESLPAVIATQGTWCLRKDLATAVASGNAITVTTNNVTLDCNDFKLGGLAAGPGSSAVGVRAAGRLNVTLRRCNVRGFNRGAYFDGAGSGGHLVEDNRFDGNLGIAIYVDGENTLVRRNLVTDTGGSTGAGAGFAAGIFSIGATSVTDNIVHGVEAAPVAGDVTGYGIAAGTASANGVSVVGNDVAGIVRAGSGAAIGISTAGRARVVDNLVALDGEPASPSVFGFYCSSTDSRLRDNIAVGVGNAIFAGCGDAGGNDATP